MAAPESQDCHPPAFRHDRLKYVTDPDNRMAQYTYYPDGKVHKLRKGPGTPLEQDYNG